MGESFRDVIYLCMEDILHCPICNNKLRTSHLPNKLLHPVGKISDYAERICSEGYNHIIGLWTDKNTKRVDLLKVSLDSNYSRFLEIDYVNQRCRIICAKNGQYEYILIPRLLIPDFPDLVELKKTVALFVVLS